jgi:hypothetical protein
MFQEHPYLCRSTQAIFKRSETDHHFAHFRQVSQLKIRGFSGEKFKDFEVLYFSVSATTTQLLSSG